MQWRTTSWWQNISCVARIIRRESQNQRRFVLPSRSQCLHCVRLQLAASLIDCAMFRQKDQHVCCWCVSKAVCWELLLSSRQKSAWSYELIDGKLVPPTVAYILWWTDNFRGDHQTCRFSARKSGALCRTLLIAFVILAMVVRLLWWGCSHANKTFAWTVR